MADNASRRGATNLGTPLMIVAFVVIGGFMYWLGSQASADIAERQALADSIAAADAERARLEDLMISAEALQRDAEPFEGREVRLEGMPVASALGTQGYWIEMPNGNPFLVSLGEGVGSVQLQPQDTVNVEGFVTAISDSILNAWTEAGTIGEGDRLAAEFATHFIEASHVETGGGQQ